MDEKQQAQFLKDLEAFATKYSLTRVKTESMYFKRDFVRQEDNSFLLMGEKAIITTLGKTTVVAIGPGAKYASYEEAEEAVRKHWSAYFKARRERRTQKERLAEARRQKRYRERRKAAIIDFKQQS